MVRLRLWSLVFGWREAAQNHRAVIGVCFGDEEARPAKVYGARGRAGRRQQTTLRWARRALDHRGGVIIVVARFVPGGRTAATLTAGLTRYSARRFAGFAATAAVGWAVYAALLGYLGGRVFHEQPLLPVLVAFAVAAGLTATVELIRQALRRHARLPDVRSSA